MPQKQDKDQDAKPAKGGAEPKEIRYDDTPWSTETHGWATRDPEAADEEAEREPPSEPGGDEKAGQKGAPAQPKKSKSE
jgi:hypothetical protein